MKRSIPPGEREKQKKTRIREREHDDDDDGGYTAEWVAPAEGAPKASCQQVHADATKQKTEEQEARVRDKLPLISMQNIPAPDDPGRRHHHHHHRAYTNHRGGVACCAFQGTEETWPV